ncbi:long-chain fatty acid--CoA ligase [candidate division KSB1 bacterium 4484_87]|nr:MAG: long-chain fatty acid--CoA ligase [candidate division KSB1 bacterium 4484_87]
MSQERTLINLFLDSVEKFSENVLLWEKHDGEYQPTTYREAKEMVFKTAAGLMALGLQPGERVVLLSAARNDWVYSELGVLFCGAMDVPLSVKLKEANELKFRFEHSQSRFAIVSQDQLEKVLKIKNDLPALEKIICLDRVETDDPDIIFMEDIRQQGEKFLQENREKFEQRYQSAKESEPANICYTSGTTADPKGIVLTHRNYTANVEQAQGLYAIPPHYVSLLILPWDHSFAHTAGIYTLMKNGASMASVELGKTLLETTRNIGKNIKEIKPHFLLSVPALSSNFRKNIEKGLKDKGDKVWNLFQRGLKIAYAYQGDGYRNGKWHGNRLLAPLYKLFDKIIFSKVREGFGGRLEFFVGGGALLDIDYQQFFTALGIPIYQGYGLTEASPIISANCPGFQKMGTSGRVVPNLEIKIVDDNDNEMVVGQKGEIVVRGENVMKEYWHNPEATAKTIKDGWLYTGDMGYMDEEGYLVVLGRYKSLLISDDGEKFSPEGIEESLLSHSIYIDQIMLYNNQNPYTVAFVVPNFSNIQAFLAGKGLDKKSEEGQNAVIQLFADEFERYRKEPEYQKQFPGKWIPATFALLGEPFTEENGFINSTMKMVRWKIAEFYKERIEYMYTPEGKNVFNKQNMTIVSRFGEK